MRIPFGASSYTHRSLPISSQRLVNCYLEQAPEAGENFISIPEAYGIRAFATVGEGPIRGGVVIKQVPYIVSGNSLYRLGPDGVTTELGNIPGTDYVDMAGDETNIVAVTHGRGYYCTGSAVLPIIAEGFPRAAWVEVLDGYYIVGKPNSQQFYISGNRDPTVWNALDFASAEKYPDDLVGAIVDHGELVLFGTESTEVWYNAGSADFPLQKTASGHFEIGIYSPFGAAKKDNSVFFPGSDGIVYRLTGYQPQRISTHAIEQAIERSADKDFRGFTWNEGGHAFYALRSSTFCFVYDISTGLWHERESYGVPTWRVQFTLRAFNSVLAVDSLTNRVGILHENSFTEWGDILRASCSSPPMGQDNRRMIFDRIELVFEAGVGTLIGQGSDPQVMLRYSDDAGRTWSNERWRPLGALGEFQERAVFNRLGQARQRVMEYAISDPVRRTLVMATAETEVGSY